MTDSPLKKKHRIWWCLSKKETERTYIPSCLISRDPFSFYFYTSPSSTLKNAFFEEGGFGLGPPSQTAYSCAASNNLANHSSESSGRSRRACWSIYLCLYHYFHLLRSVCLYNVTGLIVGFLAALLFTRCLELQLVPVFTCQSRLQRKSKRWDIAAGFFTLTICCFSTRHPLSNSCEKHIFRSIWICR